MSATSTTCGNMFRSGGSNRPCGTYERCRYRHRRNCLEEEPSPQLVQTVPSLKETTSATSLTQFFLNLRCVDNKQATNYNVFSFLCVFADGLIFLKYSWGPFSAALFVIIERGDALPGHCYFSPCCYNVLCRLRCYCVYIVLGRTIHFGCVL